MAITRPFLARLFGVIAAILGELGGLFLIFGPTYAQFSAGSNGTINQGLTSWDDRGVPTALWVLLIVLSVDLLGIALFANLGSRAGSAAWTRSTLIGCSILLGVLTVFGIASIGIFLLPSDIFALLACIFIHVQE